MIQVQLKLRFRPAQERQLERWLFLLTGVYNWALRKIEQDAAQGIYYSKFDMMRLVVGHGKKIGVSQVVLKGVACDALSAWNRCFSKQCLKPRMKGRRNRLNSLPLVDCWNLKFRGQTVGIPIIGRVKFYKQAIPEGHIGFARVLRRASGWYLSVCIQVEPDAIPAIADGTVGIDPGFSRLLTLSTGEVVEHPDELRVGAKRLAQSQRGRNRRLTARLLERQGNRRKDRNHKLSRRIVAENSVIAWSKDRPKAIAVMFGKSVTSASHSQLRQMLVYKSRAGGRQFIEVPSKNSTRTCSVCGALTGPTGLAGLSVRQWACACGATHDRDCNAAVNTLLAGLGMSHERSREAASEIST